VRSGPLLIVPNVTAHPLRVSVPNNCIAQHGTTITAAVNAVKFNVKIADKYLKVNLSWL